MTPDNQTEQDMEKRRQNLIAQAIANAEKSDGRCAPCVWYVCDWSGAEAERDRVALLDAYRAAGAALNTGWQWHGHFA